MPSRIDVRAPATITVLAGTDTVSSLGALPPYGISVNDPNNADTMTVNLVAANSGALLSASGAGGAAIGGSGNTLSITGNQAQVNAALATLLITEPTGAATDTISFSATDPTVLPAQTDIAVNVAQNYRPAFVNPPGTINLAPNTISALPGLFAADPGAMGDALAGEGSAQTLVLTLAASSGLLLLPGYAPTDGIAATGLATGTIELTFTADRLASVDSLIAGLEIAAPSANSGIAFSLRDASDPNRVSITNGNIALHIAGTAGPNGSFAAGNQSVILGAESLAAGTTLAIATTTGDLGGIVGAAALYVAPDAAFNLPYNNLTLGGSSDDFGTLAASGFSETGAIIIAEGATFSNAATFAAGALLDFSKALIAGNSAQSLNQLSITLAAGATITGNGTITAGNFSQSGVITGPGTLLALGGETLSINAGSLGGGVLVETAPGGVIVLGPDAALTGIFNDTPLTVDSSVILSFTGAPGLNPVTGGFADSYDSSGGVFVITGPEAFNGTVENFQPGDRLIFPGLSNVSLFNITNNSFSVAGSDSSGDIVTYVIDAPHPSGTSPFAALDAEGDTEVGLRPAGNEVFLNGQTISAVNLDATANVPQPIQGLDILTTAVSTLSLTVTLAVGHGVLTDGTLAPAATLTLTAANPTALNTAPAGLVYTGTGANDLLTLSAATGPLAGLSATARIFPASAGGVGAYGPTAAETVSYAAPSSAPVTAADAPGEVMIAASNDFANVQTITGISGTAMVVDTGADAVFDAAAGLAANANIVVGDNLGAGTLAIITDSFTINPGGGMVVGGAGAVAGSSVYIPGSLGVAGALSIGAGAAASVKLDGSLSAGAASLGAAGTLFAYGGAAATFGNITDAGVLTLNDQATATTGGLAVTGQLSLGGTSRLAATGVLTIATGANATIGPDARLSAAVFTQTGGTVTLEGTLAVTTGLTTNGSIDLLGGVISASGITLNAGATLAGFGILAPTGTIALNGGLIDATGGLLTLGNDVTNAGSIEIGASASLDAVHAVTGNAIAFTGTGSELIINDLGVFTAAVTSLTGHDVIDLIGIAPTRVSTLNGSITATDSLNNRIGGFALTTAASQPAITIVSDGHGGSLVTLGDEMPCFARGTRLLTPTGYRPVEALKPGDAVITAAGDRAAICWIGSRTLDFARPHTAAALPVLFTAHALGPCRPSRPVRLSPLHAVAFAGVLVPAGHLVNGATILRETARAAVTYYHVELARHDVVLADAMACESYLDTGNRGALYREVGRRARPGPACAELVTKGPRLAAIRRQLHEVALSAGYTLTYQPALRALAAGQTATPAIKIRAGRRVAQLALPAAARSVTLLSRSLSPAETDPDSEDRRQLALCLASAQISGAGDRAELGEGWLPRGAGDAGIWMGATGELILPRLPRPGSALALTFAAVVQSWQSPPPKGPDTRQDTRRSA